MPVKVFVNAIPKSGTHLAMSCLQYFPGLSKGVICEGPYPYLSYEHTVSDLQLTLEKLYKGGFFCGHIGYNQSLSSFFIESKIKSLLIVRDPRDVLISNIFFIQRNKGHYLNSFFEEINDFETKVKYLIEGCEVESSKNLIIPPLNKYYTDFLPWVELGNSLLIKYENLVGSPGGGKQSIQLKELRKIADYLELSIIDKDLKYIAKKAYNTNIANFRKGKIGDYKNLFTEATLAYINEAMKGTMQKLSY